MQDQHDNEKWKLYAAAIICVVSLAILFITVERQPKHSNTLNVKPSIKAQLAPDFTLTNVQTNKIIHLASFIGKEPVVLDFWATWCGPCRHEIPIINAVSKHFNGRVQFFGVNHNDKVSDIAAFVKDFHMAYPTLIDNKSIAAKEYQVDAIPRLIVIDQQGRIRSDTEGFDPTVDLKQGLIQELNLLLNGN